MMISNLKGQFPKLKEALTLDESDLTNSHVEAAIEASSIAARDRQSDTHLKSADLFDVEKFPALPFKFTGVTMVRDGELAVEGNLTIHSLTRKVIVSGEGGDCGCQRSLVGQYASCGIREHKDQAQRLRPDLECGDGNRRLSGRRRSDHHPGRQFVKA